MKAKLSRGSGFRGVLDYAFGDGKDPEIVGGNMGGRTAAELASEFGAFREMRPSCERPVWHCSLSCPPGERLTAEQWRGVGMDMMRHMGMAGHAFSMIRHADTDLDHVHLVASRIGVDGSLWHGAHDVRTAIAATQRIERDHGLTLTPGIRDDADTAPDQRATNTGVRNATKAEIEQADRTGDAPARMRLQEILAAALDQETKSIFAFLDEMEAAGVTAVPNVARTGRMNGFSFEIDGVPFKGSQLGKAFGWKALQERGIAYEPERDGATLVARADGIKRRIAEISGGVGEGAGPEAGPTGHGSQHDQPEVRRELGGDGANPRERDEESGSDLVIRAESDPRGDAGGRGAAGTSAAVPAGLSSYGGTDGGADLDAVADRIADLAAPADPSPLEDGPRPALTKAQQAKVQAWETQSAALAAPEYRLTLTARRDHLSTFNLGKNKGEAGAERLYTPDSVRDLIPYLSRQNLLGYDIYVTPIDRRQHFILIDDTTPEKVADMRARGFAPALVQQSSEGNVQAVLRLPRQDEKQEQKAANLLMGMLNREWGDPKISGVVHPFRMAGFSNKKPGKADVFTRVLDAAGVICGKATDMLEQARQKLRTAMQRPVKQAVEPEVVRTPMPRIAPSEGTAPESRFDALRRREVGFARMKGWALNDSALDFRAAKAMAKEGWTADEIAEAIVARSPNIFDRHRDADGYATRTAENALNERAGQQVPEGEQPPKADDRPDGPGGM